MGFMKKNELIIIADYAETSTLTFTELCEICSSSPDFIQDLIAYEIIHPQGQALDDWNFTLQHLARVKIATRLARHLEMNVPSIAVVMDLLDELDSLRDQMAILERYMK
jgi:chaperone modulatory protein CbpM